VVDSFFATIDAGHSELAKTSPDRLAVGLDFFYPDSSTQVRNVERSPLVGAAEPYLELPSTVEANGTKIDSFVDLMDIRDASLMNLDATPPAESSCAHSSSLRTSSSGRGAGGRRPGGRSNVPPRSSSTLVSSACARDATPATGTRAALSSRYST
jgi:hypothetical protein